VSKDNILILKNSGILFFRLFLTSVIGLFTSRFVIRSLGASDFGLYSVVGGVVVMMAFLNTVMVSTTYRYIAFEMGKGNNKEGINRVFNISLVIHLCLALLVLVLTETAGIYYVKNYLNVDTGKVVDALFVLRFSTYATVFSIISIPYQGLVTAQENFAVRATIEIIRSLLVFFVALVIVYYTGNRLRLYALLVALVSVVPALLFFIYCKHKYSKIIKWNFQRGKSKYKEMIGFSGWIMIGAAASVGKTTGSALIINAFFGTILNAAFGIANQVNSIVLMFAQNLGQAAIPQITKSFSSGNTNRTIKLVAHISKYTCFLMLLPSLPILLETDFLLTLWLGELPQYTVIFCQLMIINALIDSLGSGIPAAVHATGKIKYFQIILSTTSLLSLPIAYFLFKAGYSPSSILAAFISTAIINVVVRQILLKKLINFNVIYFLKTSYLKILYVSVFIAPLFFIQDFFPAGPSRFIFFSFFAMGWLISVIYFTGIEKEEKEMLRLILKKIIRTK
jgi:O-antigen/teichoic acid export membrane protein